MKILLKESCFALNKEQTRARLYINVDAAAFISGFLFYFYGSFFLETLNSHLQIHFF